MNNDDGSVKVQGLQVIYCDALTRMWRFGNGIAVTAFGVSTKLLYAKPG